MHHDHDHDDPRADGRDDGGTDRPHAADCACCAGRSMADVWAETDALIAAGNTRVIGVLPDEDQPGFAYTVGMVHLFEHPEVLVVGLPHPTGAHVLNAIRDLVRGGWRAEVGVTAGGVLQGGYGVRFVPVDEQTRATAMAQAVGWYGGPGFPALQCLWPDAEGRLPGDPGCPPEFTVHQSVDRLG